MIAMPRYAVIFSGFWQLSCKTCLSIFGKTTKNYLRKIQDKKNETAGSGFFVPEESDIQEASSSNYSGFNDRQIEVLQDVQQGLDERDQEIMRIAKSINDLGQIFKELAVLVIDQGTILDRIDYNMEQVEDKVEKGVEELEKAKELQKKVAPYGAWFSFWS